MDDNRLSDIHSAEGGQTGEPEDAMSGKTDPARARSDGQQDEVVISIRRHEQLFQLLQHPRQMWRVLFSLLLIVMVVFAGLATVALAIKSIYPYNVIETNVQGASIMKNEDKDVIYWLFSTADLWANSGVEVQKNDELTIRASGASYTAIHHLVKASEGNSLPTDEWVGTEGQPRNVAADGDLRDLLRSKYRISQTSDEGILLMQVVDPNQTNDAAHRWTKQLDPKWERLLTNGHIEVIGKERRSLRISEPGVLHFTVNDIVLTDDVLCRMYAEFIDTLSHYFPSINRQEATKLFGWLGSANNDTTRMALEGLLAANRRLLESAAQSDGDASRLLTIAKRRGLALGTYPIVKDPQSSAKGDSTRYHNAYPLINELVYYKEKHYRDPWFQDNIGSFLIVIERKR